MNYLPGCKTLYLKDKTYNALDLIINAEVMAGTNIHVACDEAAKLATITLSEVHVSFNDINMVIKPGSDPLNVIADWNNQCAERSKAYWTPERLEEQEMQNDLAQEKYNSHLQLLYHLDFDNSLDVARWLCRLEEVALNSITKLSSSAILEAFAKHDLVPNMNLSNDQDWFLQQSKDFKLKWVIGQGLDGVRICGAPHGVIHSFVERFA